jgi:hypothetical protein
VARLRRQRTEPEGRVIFDHRHNAAKSARPIQRLIESPWCSISPAMASGSHERQSRGCDSMMHGNGLPLALFSQGVAFDLKRRRRHAAPHEVPGKSACHLEMGAGYQKMISHTERCERVFRLICNLENISLGFALIHDPEPTVLPVTRIVRC